MSQDGGKSTSSRLFLVLYFVRRFIWCTCKIPCVLRRHKAELRPRLLFLAFFIDVHSFVGGPLVVIDLFGDRIHFLFLRKDFDFAWTIWVCVTVRASCQGILSFAAILRWLVRLWRLLRWRCYKRTRIQDDTGFKFRKDSGDPAEFCLVGSCGLGQELAPGRRVIRRSGNRLHQENLLLSFISNNAQEIVSR